MIREVNIGGRQTGYTTRMLLDATRWMFTSNEENSSVAVVYGGNPQHLFERMYSMAYGAISSKTSRKFQCPFTNKTVLFKGAIVDSDDTLRGLNISRKFFDNYLKYYV